MTPDEAKDARLRKTYKKTLVEYNAQLEEQDWKCAICGRDFAEFTPYNDHDHACCKPSRSKKAKNEFCGKCNRALICYLCNKYAIGLIEWAQGMEHPIPIDKALAYIEAWRKVIKARGGYEPKEKGTKTKRVSKKQKSV